MSYINVGAYVNGDRPRTKKALREALASAPETVTFDQTSMFSVARGPDPAVLYRTTIPAGVTLTVVGPDPYTDRRWYTSVWVKDGRVMVK